MVLVADVVSSGGAACGAGAAGVRCGRGVGLAWEAGGLGLLVQPSEPARLGGWCKPSGPARLGAPGAAGESV